MKIFSIIVAFLCLVSCAGIPAGIEPVTDFKLERYAGKWYEIARLDHRFERGLEKVTAEYSINADGTVRVENRGFSTKNNEWKNAVGRAKFAGSSNIGHLKVSFFGPFYGSYVVFELDRDRYQYSFVTGSENTLWLLSRNPKVSEEIRAKFVNAAKKAGYNTEELIFVNQD